jgi:hypothetical protein
MKIIGKADDRTFIVQMEEGEIAKAVGFAMAWGEEWKAALRKAGADRLVAGMILDVHAAHAFHSECKAHEAELQKAMRLLKMLADKVVAGLPGAVITRESD